MSFQRNYNYYWQEHANDKLVWAIMASHGINMVSTNSRNMLRMCRVSNGQSHIVLCIAVWMIVTFATIPSCECQRTINLAAPDTGQATDNIEVWFADGQNTSDIGQGYLPRCEVSTQTGSVNGTFIRLKSAGAKKVIQYHGEYENVTTNSGKQVSFNTTAVPVLDASYTGQYVCETDGPTESVKTYKINIVKPIVPSYTYRYLSPRYGPGVCTILYNIWASLPVTTSWSSATPLPGSTSSIVYGPSVNGVRKVTCEFNFTGHTIINNRVRFAASYTGVDCDGLVSAPPASVVTNCQAATTTVNLDFKVSYIPRCLPSDSIQKNFQFLSTFSQSIGSIVSTKCTTGYYQTNPAITSITCQASGAWSELPFCQDINECATQCRDSNSNCTNTPGAFVCTCKSGYTGNNPTCQDIDECQTQCNGQGNICTNTDGSFTCGCVAGYLQNGLNCEDIDECQTQCNGQENSCINIVGSFMCGCVAGYLQNGLNCEDINECATQCRDSSLNCTNTPGDFMCTCQFGYTGDFPTCQDIDECQTQCNGQGTNCTNTDGSFTCGCVAGYLQNGLNCSDIDECQTQCNGQGNNCTNTDGNFTCECVAGYLQNGLNCSVVPPAAAGLQGSAITGLTVGVLSVFVIAGVAIFFARNARNAGPHSSSFGYNLKTKFSMSEGLNLSRRTSDMSEHQEPATRHTIMGQPIELSHSKSVKTYDNAIVQAMPDVTEGNPVAYDNIRLCSDGGVIER